MDRTSFISWLSSRGFVAHADGRTWTKHDTLRFVVFADHVTRQRRATSFCNWHDTRTDVLSYSSLSLTPDGKLHIEWVGVVLTR